MAKVGGESTALVNDCFVGGVVGLNKGTVEYNVNESEVTAKNYSSGDSIVAAGGIVGATIDAGVSESKNSGSVFGEYVYAGGVAGVAVSDSGAYIVEKCDNDGEVSSGYGVAGGIVGRAVAAGEGYVTIKLSVVDCNNTGALSGNATGEVSGETATVESAQVVLGEEVSAYAGTCSSKTLSVITAASEQYGANIQATGEGSMSKLQIGSTDKYIVRFNGEGGIFAPRPVIVTWTMVTDTGAVEIVSVDASGLTLADGTLSGELKFKVYTPDTLAAATSVVGVSVGNQFVLADFVGVDTSKRCVEYTANISAATTAAGTINVNVHVVDTTDAMNPLCDKKTASK